MGGLVLLIGRVVFSFFFIYSGFNHLTKLSVYAQYAGASGVPAPTVLTALSGLMLLAGGLSILLGVKAQWGSLLIAAFLIPAAFMVHKFLGIAGPMMAANQAAHFWKNIALTGACLMFYGLTTLYPCGCTVYVDDRHDRHVCFMSAVACPPVNGSGRGVPPDGAVARRGCDRGAPAADFQTAVPGRSMDRNPARQPTGEAPRDVVLFHAV